MQPKMPDIDFGALTVKGLIMGFPLLLKVFFPYIIMFLGIVGVKRWLNARSASRSDYRSAFPSRQHSQPSTNASMPPLGRAQAASNVSSPAICVLCGKPVSEKVKTYCRNRPKRFGGQIYCYQHQRTVS